MSVTIARLWVHTISILPPISPKWGFSATNNAFWTKFSHKNIFLYINFPTAQNLGGRPLLHPPATTSLVVAHGLRAHILYHASIVHIRASDSAGDIVRHTNPFFIYSLASTVSINYYYTSRKLIKIILASLGGLTSSWPPSSSSLIAWIISATAITEQKIASATGTSQKLEIAYTGTRP